jgi:hypothetical protein
MEKATQYCDNFMLSDAMSSRGDSMKVGCGLVEKEIRGNRYLYFWCFQGRGAGVKKIERYMGPASDSEARRRTLREIEAYAARASAEFAERIAAWRRELARP